MVNALIHEIILRKSEMRDTKIYTIYFGGGTPSILSVSEIQSIIDSIHAHYTVVEDPEITLEANPDDLSKEKITALADSAVNRLSIGIQSFFDEDLQLMNRAHNSQEALDSLTMACEKFQNISIDLIYGIPNMSIERWQQNMISLTSLAMRLL